MPELSPSDLPTLAAPLLLGGGAPIPPPGPQDMSYLARHARVYGPRITTDTVTAHPIAVNGSTSPVPYSVPLPGKAGQIDEAPSPWSARLVAVEDMDTVLAWLPNAFRPMWEWVKNEPGAGELFLANDDPAVPLIVAGTAIQCLLYGDVVFTFIVRNKRRVLISNDEEVAQVCRVSGEGHAGVFEWLNTYPYGGTGMIPVEKERTFNWTAPRWVFDDFSWPTATSYGAAGCANTTWPCLPVSWPADSGDWIWANHVKAGVCYFRGFLDVPDGLDQVLFMVSADDECEVYIDGVLLLKHDQGPARISTKAIPMTAGDHVIAIAGFKRPRQADSPGTHTVVAGDTLEHLGSTYYQQPGWGLVIYNANRVAIDNANSKAGRPIEEHALDVGLVLNIPGVTESEGDAGVLLTAYAADSDGEVTDPPVQLWNTNDAWQVVAYPDNPPGMRPGKAFRVVFREAYRRGAGPRAAATDMLDDTDTRGEPWPVVADITTKTGTDLLTFLRELSVAYIDWRMYPATLGLAGFVKGTMGSVPGVTPGFDLTFEPPTDPEDPSTGNLLRFELDEMLEIPANAFLVGWPKGWLDRTRQESVDDVGYRVEATLGLGAALSIKEAWRDADAELDRLARTQETYELSFVPRDVTEVPGIGWFVGDFAAIEHPERGTEAVEIVACRVTVDDDGYVEFAPKMGDVWDDHATATNRTMKKMANGTLGGQSKIATPIDGTFFDTDCCPPAVPEGGCT